MANAILWYEIKNLGSFEEEGGFVDLTTTSKDKKRDLWADVDGQKVNLVTAIMGANGSGKTTLLKPMSFLGWLFWSIPAKITSRLYLNINKPLRAPAEVKISFVLNREIYTYEVTAFDHFIVSEKLFKRNKNNKNVYVFKRELAAKSIIVDDKKDNDGEFTDKEHEKFLKSLKYTYVEKNDLFDLGVDEAKRTPPNTSIISAARRVGVALADEIADRFASVTNVNAVGRHVYGHDDMGHAAEILFEDEPSLIRIKKVLMSWDLGLHDIRIEREDHFDKDGEKDTQYRVLGVHLKEDGTKYELPFSLESAGTQSAFVRLFNINHSLTEGVACFIDELGDDLHPHMVKPIIELFTSRETNPLCAQLVFTCHKPELINYLGKYRILITEKKYNKSECYRLDEFSSSDARVDDNLASKYLAGAFGGVPDL